MQNLLKLLQEREIEFLENVDLSESTYMKTGGTAKLVIRPTSKEQVMLCIHLLKKFNFNYKVIGATSNLLFLDDTDYSCLLSTINLKGLIIDNLNKEIISAGGEMLGDLSRFALIHSAEGFEGLEGIPGTVGGAVFMNAGAYGYETKKVLKSIELVDENGDLKSLQVDELEMNYRNSVLKKGKVKGIVVSATFCVKNGSQNEIEKRMELYHSKRHKYQEFLYPNLGSCFSGSIYRALGKKDPTFKLISMLYFLINYKLKIFRRESPINRNWINNIAVKRFNLRYNKQPFSHKNINTLVNRGQGTNEMLRFIKEIDRLSDSKIPLENEIIERF